jgi:hypothetical protein
VTLRGRFVPAMTVVVGFPDSLSQRMRGASRGRVQRVDEVGLLTVDPRRLAARFRTRRSAAIAGIVFGVLLLAAMIMLRIALSEGGLDTLGADVQQRNLIRVSLSLVPFAGIAFLWFIGVVREQLGAVEDRLFSTVFMGSGLLFLAMLFTGAATSTSLLVMVGGADVDTSVLVYGQNTAQGLISVYAMRMAAVFTISVSTVGLRTAGLPRWVSYLGYAMALVLLIAAAQQRWTQLVFPSWVLLVSVVILVVRPGNRAGTAEAGPGAT